MRQPWIVGDRPGVVRWAGPSSERRASLQDGVYLPQAGPWTVRTRLASAASARRRSDRSGTAFYGLPLVGIRQAGAVQVLNEVPGTIHGPGVQRSVINNLSIGAPGANNHSQLPAR